MASHGLKTLKDLKVPFSRFYDHRFQLPKRYLFRAFENIRFQLQKPYPLMPFMRSLETEKKGTSFAL